MSKQLQNTLGVFLVPSRSSLRSPGPSPFQAQGHPLPGSTRASQAPSPSATHPQGGVCPEEHTETPSRPSTKDNFPSNHTPVAGNTSMKCSGVEAPSWFRWPPPFPSLKPRCRSKELQQCFQPGTSLAESLRHQITPQQAPNPTQRLEKPESEPQQPLGDGAKKYTARRMK